jgi:hypothetical protein
MPILDVNPHSPLLDGRQSERALMVRRGVSRLFAEIGVVLVAELPLSSGRRADLVGLDRRGRFTLIEIKSSIEDFRSDSKWPDYLAHCDAFYFATHAGVPADLFPQNHGLIIADHYGAEIIRPASDSAAMPGATRKALTLRFARAAADRLERVLSHQEASGGTLPEGLHRIGGE